MSREERKEDVRIYIVTALIFSCLISGGVFLGLYIFHPPNNVKTWYPIAGMILIGIPWMFWFLTYIYRCIRPDAMQSQPREAYASPPAHHEAAATATMNLAPGESPVQSPDGARHVHFGEVVVINNDNNNNNNRSDGVVDAHQGAKEHSYIEHEGESSVTSRESEIPLNCSTSS